MVLEVETKMVHGARMALKSLQGDFDMKLALFHEETQELHAEMEAARQTIAALETELREAAVGIFTETGEKQVAPGIGIRETTEASFDSGKALEWARANASYMLQLNTKAFVSFAKEAKPPPEFVTITHPATATIARDLGPPIFGAKHLIARLTLCPCSTTGYDVFHVLREELAGCCRVQGGSDVG